MARVIDMPTADDIDKAYVASTSRVPARYKAGVEKNTNQKERSIAGQTLYEAKMADPEVLRRRKTKIEESPEGAWKDGAKGPGVDRIAKGMQRAAPKRKANYEKIRSALQGAELSEKVADADTNIDNNVKKVVRIMQEAAGTR